MKIKSWDLDFEQWEPQALLYKDELQEEKATSAAGPGQDSGAPRKFACRRAD